MVVFFLLFSQTVKTGEKKEILDPFKFSFPFSTNVPIDFTFTFHGHYREQPLAISYSPDKETCFYRLAYDITNGEWHTMLVN